MLETNQGRCTGNRCNEVQYEANQTFVPQLWVINKTVICYTPGIQTPPSVRFEELEI